MNKVEFENLVEVFVDLIKWKAEAENPALKQEVSQKLH